MVNPIDGIVYLLTSPCLGHQVYEGTFTLVMEVLFHLPEARIWLPGFRGNIRLETHRHTHIRHCRPITIKQPSPNTYCRI